MMAINCSAPSIRALLVDQPLHPSHPLPADPISYGQRLAAALGGPAFAELVTALPRAPNANSLITFETADPDLAAIPWEYLHNGRDFLILDYLLVRQVPDADLPAPPAPSAHWRLVAMGSDPLLGEVRDPQTHLLTGYAPMRRLLVVQDLDALRDRLLSQQPPIPVQWQRIAPTLTALIDLATADPILFHYTGHGNVTDGQPILCFDDGTGRMDPSRCPAWPSPPVPISSACTPARSARTLSCSPRRSPGRLATAPWASSSPPAAGCRCTRRRRSSSGISTTS
jgi:hypothetical protein